MNTSPTTKPHPTLKTLLIATALFLRLFIAPLSSFASDVLILKDSDIKPYQEAIQGFKETCGCSVRELDLSDMDAVELAIKATPDAIAAVGSRAFRKIRKIRSVPLIYLMAMPSETADVKGENVSGVSMDIAPDTCLSTMTGLFPDAKRIGLLYNPANTGTFVREASEAALEKKVSLIRHSVSNPQEAFVHLNELRGTVDVVWMLPDTTLMNSAVIDHLLLLSFQESVPVFSFTKKYVEMGAVAALIVAPRDMGKQAGEMTRSLVQGNKGPLRAYARNPRLIVNTKVGAKLGVRINDDTIRNAEKVE